MAQEKGLAWRCLLCGYIHYGPQPPDECPVCGAGADEFEPYQEAPATPAPASKATPAGGTAPAVARVVIVGAGIAGVAAAESLRQAAPAAEIALLSREAGLPYHRLNLTRYLAGE